MANPAAGIRAAVAARYPDAVLIERGLSHLRHRRVDPDGRERFIYDGVIGALHYKDDQDSWQEIDNDLEDDGADGFSVHTGHTGHLLRMAADGKRRLYPNRYDLTRYVEFSGLPSPGTPQRGANYLAWDRPHFAAKITNGGGGIKFTFTLKDASAPTSVSFNVALVGLTRQGRVLLADGVPVAEMRLPTAVDAAGTERDCAFTLTAGKVTISLDTTGLVFPIEIDPTVDVQVGASNDDGYRYGASSFGRAAQYCYVGFSGYPYHTFLRWTGVTIESHHVDVSYIEVYPYAAAVGTPTRSIYGVDEDNPAGPTSAATFDADPLTEYNIDWIGEWTAATWNQSDSLNDIFQELADSYAISNEAVMLQIRDAYGGGTNLQQLRSWDYTGNLHGPKLHIESHAAGQEPQAVAGALTMAGSLTRKVMRGVAGALAPVGALSEFVTLTGVGNLVGTSNTEFATRTTLQRKGFYAAGRFWSFYVEYVLGNWPGDAELRGLIVFRTSTDGITWSAKTDIAQDWLHGAGFSVYFDGVYFHYVRVRIWYDTGLSYRRGLPNSDGTVTWSAAEQVIFAHDAWHLYEDPSIVLDSDGYPWVGYDHGEASGYPFNWAFDWSVTKSSAKDGTWVTEETWLLPEAGHNQGFVWSSLGEIVALTDGKLYSIYISHFPNAGGNWHVMGKLWSGTSWGAEETISTTYVHSEFFSEASAIAVGDDVHVAFLAEPDAGVCYVKRTYGVGWGSTEVVLSSGSEVTSPILSCDAATGDIYCFWESSPTADHIYFRIRDAESQTWGAVYDWIDESTDGLGTNEARLTVFCTSIGAVLGLLYTTKTGQMPSSHNVKLAILKMPPQNFYQALTGALTSAGALARRAKTTLTGALTSAGLLTGKALKALAGSLTSDGTLPRKAFSALAGGLTSSGALVKKGVLGLSGALTSSGALGAILVFLKSVGGTLTPAGVVSAVSARLMAVVGTLTSAGDLTRRSAYAVVGILTSSGALATLKLFLSSVAGALTSAGGLGLGMAKALTGALTSSGAVGRITAFTKGVAGALTPTGALSLISARLKDVAGALASAGNLTRLTAKVTGLAGALTSSGIVSGIQLLLKGVAGTLTSSGTVLGQGRKALAGSLTSTGALIRKISQGLVGSLSSSGVMTTATVYLKSLAGALTSSGTVVTLKVFLQSVAGALTSAGVLVGKAQKVLAGGLTSAGIIARKTGLSVAGALTNAGALTRQMAYAVIGVLTSSGVLTTLKLFLVSVAGTLSSSGTLLAKAQKVLGGGLAAGGTLARNIGKVVAGALTSAGGLGRWMAYAVAGILTSSGTLATLKVLLKAVSGTLTSAGVLATKAQKALAGAVTSTGDLVRKVAQGLAGSLTLAGSVTRAVARLVSLAGGLTPTGALGTLKVILKAVAGALTSSGSVARLSSKVLGGTLTSAGTVAGKAKKVLAGALTLTGILAAVRLANTFFQTIGGALTSSGLVTRLPQKALSGTLTSAGSLGRGIGYGVAGVLTSSGSLARRIGRGLAGVLSAVGAVIQRLFVGGAPTVIDLVGSYEYTISLAGSYIHTLALVGSYVPTLALVGSYQHVIDLSGSHVPEVEMEASYG